MAPLSHAFDDLKFSIADTAVFPESEVSCMVRTILCDFRDYDCGLSGCLC